jgi:hypothetical protein
MAERLIRYLEIPRHCERPEILVEVHHGQQLDPPRAASADWLAVSHVSDAANDKYVLYFLTRAGDILDFCERDTLKEVLQEAAASIGIESPLWVMANLEVPEQPLIPRNLLP